MTQPHDFDVPSDWIALLQRPGAKAIWLELRDELDIPTAVMLIPAPKNEPEVGIPSPAMGVMFGIEMFPSRDEPPPPAPEVLPDIPLASVDAVRQRMANGESFLLVVSSESCGTSVHFGPLVRQLVGDSEQVAVANLAHEHVTDQEAYDALANELFPGLLAFPTLLHIREGRVVDRVVGSDYWSARHFFARNGHLEDGSYARSLNPTTADRRVWLRTLSLATDLGGSSGKDQDLSGLRLAGGSLAGSDLRNANLSGADLTNAVLSHADLSGANLTDAKLDGALWYGTTCPDGSQSSGLHDGCKVR